MNNFYEKAEEMIEEILTDPLSSAGDKTYSRLLAMNVKAGNMEWSNIQLKQIKHEKAHQLSMMLAEYQ